MHTIGKEADDSIIEDVILENGFFEFFAEYLMSKNPTKVAIIFGEIIDDALGHQEGFAMMPVNSNMTDVEAESFAREAYENNKEGLISVFRERGYDESKLNQFLVNSLRGYEKFLKEDGLQ